MDIYATEEEQVEAIKKWWKENGTSVILGLVIGLAALFGWRAWQAKINVSGEQASTLFSKLNSLIAEKKYEDAAAAGQQLMDNFEETPYASFAALMLANVAVDSGDTELAAQQLRWVADHASLAEIKFTASLRLARLYLSNGDADAAWALITVLEADSKRSSVHELKGDILLAKNKPEKAKNAYLQALALTPSGPGANSLLEMKLDDLGGSRE